MRYVKHMWIVMVFLVACSSDATSTDATSTTSETTTTVDESTTTEDETTTTDADTDTDDASDFSGVDPNDPVVVAYCEDALAADVASNEFTSSGNFDAATVEQYYADQIERINEAVPPPEIEEAFETVKANLVELDAAFARIDYDINNDTTEIDAVDADGASRSASLALDAFEASFCPDMQVEADPTIDIGALLETEEGRELLAGTFAETLGITEAQALCFLANTDPETVAGVQAAVESGGLPDTTVIQGMLAGMAICGLELSDFGG